MTQTNYANIDYVVGIDFGTTFSGASHAFTRDNVQRCCHITQWPKQKGFIDNQKIPTACLYDKEQQTFTRWGRDALDYHKSKRQQQRDVVLVENFNEQLRASLESNSDDHFYKDAAVYFFRHMLQYSKKEIDGYVVRNIKHPVILHVLSLPSNWSTVARNEMRQLFTESILDTDDHFEIIDQFQAAASFCQNKNGNQTTLIPGENYLVCDLGGAISNFTLFESVPNDAQTLQVSKTQDNQNIESIIALGSSHIDIKMKEYISQLIFNNDADAIEKSSSLIRYLMDYFIHSVKPIFGEVVEEAVLIPMVLGGAIKPSTMELLTENGTISRGQLHIPYRDMCTYVFDPVVDQIIASMGKFILNSTKMMDKTILIGGFSESYYLQQQIKDRLGGRIGELVVNINGNVATMDGATYYGLEKVNSARKLSDSL